MILGTVGFRMAQKPIAQKSSPTKLSHPVVEQKPTMERPINVAVFGVDEDGYRSDVNFVVSFNEKNKDIHLVSVPRDTRVIMTPDMVSSLEKRNKKVPRQNGVKGQCKLTEVFAYAGEEHRSEFSVAMLEDILGIQVDYYVKVNLSGFRDIVDAVDGVDMEVAERLYYRDATQSLFIDLQPGFQHLNGAKAEQLVRFRDGYAQKDLKRIQVQQDFMKAFLEKIMGSETIMSNFSELIKIVLKNVETDVAITDVLKYVKYVKDISQDHIYMETIPGEGGSYFDYDIEGTEKMVQRVFYGIASEETMQNRADEAVALSK